MMMEQDDDALCGWAQDEEQDQALGLSGSQSHGSLKSKSSSTSFVLLPSRAVATGVAPVRTHMAPARTKLAMAAVSIGSSGEAPPRAKRGKGLISALRVRSESDIERRCCSGTEPSDRQKQHQQLRSSPSARVMDTNWPALYRFDPASPDDAHSSSGYPEAAATAYAIVVPTCKIVELIPDSSDAEAGVANTLPALHGSHSASGAIGVSFSRTQSKDVRRQPPWVCTDEANAPDQLNHYAWELRPHKKALTRHHRVTRSTTTKHQQSQPLRPMKQRARTLVRDLVADSVASELKNVTRDLEHKIFLQDRGGVAKDDVNLWEYQHEQTSSTMYENSMGIVKALTQFSKQLETNPRLGEIRTRML